MAITSSFDKTYDATLIILLIGFVAGLVFFVMLTFYALKGTETDLVERSKVSANKIGYQNFYNPVISPMEKFNDSRRGSSAGWNNHENTDSLQLVNSKDVGSNPFENSDVPYPEPSSSTKRKESVGGVAKNSTSRFSLNHQSMESYGENIQLKTYNSNVGPEIRITGPSDEVERLV